MYENLISEMSATQGQQLLKSISHRLLQVEKLRVSVVNWVFGLACIT